MTVQTVPYALQNASHSAALFRQSASAPFVTGGILQPGELALSQQSTPNMSIVLGPGRAKVPGTQVSPPAGLHFTTQGMYDTLNDANLTLTVTASNPTNPRIDAVYMQVQDSFYGGSTNQALAGIVAGTPAASPVAPALPSNAILIGYVAVGANVASITSANISNLASVASTLGNCPPVPSKAVRDLTYPNPVQGQLCYRTDMSWVEAYYGLYDPVTNTEGAAIAGWYPIAGKLPRLKLYPVKTGIGGITTVQYCFGGGGANNNYLEIPGGNYVDGMTFDQATGRIVPSVVGRYRIEIRLRMAPGSGASLVLAASINSTTSPTQHGAGSAANVNGVFANTEQLCSSGIQGAYLTGEISTTAVTDFLQLWFSAGLGTTGIQAPITASYPNQYVDFLKVEYVGPPILDH